MKGSLFDMAGILMVVLIGGMVLLAVAYMLGAFQDAVAGVPMIAGNAKAMDTLQSGEDTLQGMDSLFAFFILMMCMGAVISAFLAPSHPIMFILFFLFTLLLIPIAGAFSEMFSAFYATGPMAGVEVDYPITLLVFEWLPKITVAVSALIAIAMWGVGGARGGIGRLSY